MFEAMRTVRAKLYVGDCQDCIKTPVPQVFSFIRIKGE